MVISESADSPARVRGEIGGVDGEIGMHQLRTGDQRTLLLRPWQAVGDMLGKDARRGLGIDHRHWIVGKNERPERAAATGADAGARLVPVERRRALDAAGKDRARSPLERWMPQRGCARGSSPGDFGDHEIGVLGQGIGFLERGGAAIARNDSGPVPRRPARHDRGRPAPASRRH